MTSAGGKQAIMVEENSNNQKHNEESTNNKRKDDNNNIDAQSSIKEHEVYRGKELLDVSSKEGRGAKRTSQHQHQQHHTTRSIIKKWIPLVWGLKSETTQEFS